MKSHLTTQEPAHREALATSTAGGTGVRPPVSKGTEVFMTEMFRNGGWGMFPTAIFGVLLMGASILYAVRPDRRFVPIQISLGIVTLMAGSLGFVTGLIRSLGALQGVDQTKRWIWLLGMGESLNDIALAMALIVLAGLVASVGTLRIAFARA